MELVDSDGLVEGTTIYVSPEKLPPDHTRRPCPAVLGPCCTSYMDIGKWVYP